MTLHRLYFGGLLAPDTGGSVWWQPAGILDTNDLASQTPVLIYSGSTIKNGASCWVPVPKNYINTGTTKVGVLWKAVPTTGDVVWDIDYKAIGDNEPGDPSGWDESLTTTVTTRGTARNFTVTEVTITASNLAIDDMVLMVVSRDQVDAADTMAGSAELIDAWLEYSDV